MKLLMAVLFLSNSVAKIGFCPGLAQLVLFAEQSFSLFFILFGTTPLPCFSVVIGGVG